MAERPASPLPWSWDEESSTILDANGEEVLAGVGYDGRWRDLLGDDRDIAFLIAAVNARAGEALRDG